MAACGILSCDTCRPLLYFVDSVRKYRRAAHFADAKSEESDKLPADSEDGPPPSEE